MNRTRVTLRALTLLLATTIAIIATAATDDHAAKEKEDGFAPLFNGKDTEGWTYDGKHDPKTSKGYYAKDGILICDKDAHGNLYTEKDYDNFVLRFDFKLVRNGNNGIGVHCPTTGDIAYQGIEIQILDDDGDMYKGKIQPWQHHGSVYGCVPAKPGALKPVGEWNSEEIVVDHRHIKVTLNDKVIVDTDLDKDVTDPEVLAKHPGLKRTTGKIGLLGHTDQTEFRNLRVKELK